MSLSGVDADVLRGERRDVDDEQQGERRARGQHEVDLDVGLQVRFDTEPDRQIERGRDGDVEDRRVAFAGGDPGPAERPVRATPARQSLRGGGTLG